jgi:hypothetical protein
MKLHKFVLTLTAAALLPVIAHAADDPVAASFDRAFINDSYLSANREKADQVMASFDRAFINDAYLSANREKADQVVASFDRAFINDSFISASREANPVVASFDRAFGNEVLVNAYRTGSDQVLASFERDESHDPVAPETMIARTGDDLLDAINAVLRGETGKSKVVTAIIESGRHGG